MGNLQFGTYDLFQGNIIEEGPEPVDYYDQHIKEVRMAEGLGFDYNFVIEHQGNNNGQCSAPFVYLSALAQNTSTIRFGAMIFQLPFYNPIRLAQDAAMLDQLSRGRLEFGAGIGVLEHEFIRWNLRYEDRREISQETLGIVEKAWTEDTVTHQGKYWTFDEAIATPHPYQKPHPPIWFGCHSPESFQYAAAHNYDVSQNLDTDIVVAEKFDMWRDMWKAHKHPGTLPRTFLQRAVHVAETDELVRQEAEQYLLRAYTLGTERLRQSRIGLRGIEPTPTNQVLIQNFAGMAQSLDFWLDNGLAHVGSPETVAKRIEKQQELCGLDILCGRHRFADIPTPLVEKSIRLFGEKVIPALK